MQRPAGQRYATPDEAIARRRIIASIDLLKKQLTTPEVAQVIKAFVRFVHARNIVAADAIKYMANTFIESIDTRGYRPFDIEYKADDDEILEKEEEQDGNTFQNLQEHKMEPSPTQMNLAEPSNPHQ